MTNRVYLFRSGARHCIGPDMLTFAYFTKDINFTPAELTVFRIDKIIYRHIPFIEETIHKYDSCFYYSDTEISVPDIDRYGRIISCARKANTRLPEFLLNLGISASSIVINFYNSNCQLDSVCSVPREEMSKHHPNYLFLSRYIAYRKIKNILHLHTRYPEYDLYSHRGKQCIDHAKKVILNGPVYGQHHEGFIRTLCKWWLKLQLAVDPDIFVLTDGWFYKQPKWWKLRGSWLDGLSRQEKKIASSLYNYHTNPIVSKNLADMTPMLIQSMHKNSNKKRRKKREQKSTEAVLGS